MSRKSTRSSSRTKTPKQSIADKKLSDTDPAVTEVARRLFSLRESFKCGICLDLISIPSRLDCGHSFCTTCLKNFLSVERKGKRKKTSVSCPACNRPGITKRSLNLKDVEEQNDILNSFTASATVALTRLEECLAKTTGIDFRKVQCASNRLKNQAGTKEAPSPNKPSSVSKAKHKGKEIEENSDDILGCPSDASLQSQWNVKREARPKTYSGNRKATTTRRRSDSPAYDDLYDEDQETRPSGRVRSKSPEVDVAFPAEAEDAQEERRGAVRSNSPELDDVTFSKGTQPGQAVRTANSSPEHRPINNDREGETSNAKSSTTSSLSAASPTTAPQSSQASISSLPEASLSDSKQQKKQSVAKATETSFVTTSMSTLSPASPTTAVASDTSFEPPRSRPGRKKKVMSSAESTHMEPAKEEPAPNKEPSVGEVCKNLGLTDVDLEYGDAEYQNLTSHKLFQQSFYQRIQAGNPKVARAKVMKLVAAKWRQFQSLAACANEANSCAVEPPKSKGRGKEQTPSAESSEKTKKLREVTAAKDSEEEKMLISRRGKKRSRTSNKAAHNDNPVPEEPQQENQPPPNDNGPKPVFQFRKMGRIKQIERVASVSDSPKRGRRIPFIQMGLLAPTEPQRPRMEDLPSLQQIVETSRRRRSSDIPQKQTDVVSNQTKSEDKKQETDDKTAQVQQEENVDPSSPAGTKKKRGQSESPVTEVKKRRLAAATTPLDEATPPRAAFDRGLQKIDRRTSTMIETPPTVRILGRYSNTSTPSSSTSSPKFSFKPSNKLSTTPVRMLDTVDLEAIAEEKPTAQVSRGEEEKGSSDDLDKRPASASLLSGSSGGNNRASQGKKTVEGITPLSSEGDKVDRRDALNMDVGEIETELEKLKKSIRTSDLFPKKKEDVNNDSWQDTVLISPPPAKSMDSEEEATMIQEILEDENNRTQRLNNDEDSDSDDMFSATPEPVNQSKRFFGNKSANKSNELRSKGVKRTLITPKKDEPPNKTSNNKPVAPTKKAVPSKLFKQVEVCFLTETARRDVARVVRDGGGLVVDSVMNMTPDEGNVGVCVTDMDGTNGEKGARLRNDHFRTFATSSVAVVSKAWITESVDAGRLLPLGKFLQHEATHAALKKADYPEHLCK